MITSALHSTQHEICWSYTDPMLKRCALSGINIAQGFNSKPSCCSFPSLTNTAAVPVAVGEMKTVIIPGVNVHVHKVA
jgi:hypothetical protein